MRHDKVRKHTKTILEMTRAELKELGYIKAENESSRKKD